MSRVFDFHGGVHPPENKIQSTSEAIGRIPLARELVLPLNQHIGKPAQALVKPGQEVLKGQLIAAAQGTFSANIHASTSGTVTCIEERVANHPSGMSTLSIVLEPDNRDAWIELADCPDPFVLSASEIVEAIYKAGVAGMGGAGFPTAIKLGAQNLTTLILNAAECEPYITADDMLMREQSTEIISGVLLLASVLHVKKILIGIEDNKPQAISALSKTISSMETRGITMELVVVPTKYPSGGEKQLIKLLTGLEVPAGKLPSGLGMVLQNVATVRAIWRATRFGEPLVSRVTTVTGGSLLRQRNVNLPLGTPVSHLLGEHGFNREDTSGVIIGGPMMGYAINDLSVPVTKTTNCVLAPSKTELATSANEKNCIRCGMCAEACPVKLLPQQLFWYAKAGDHEKTKAYQLFDCIECGACSYVCPSHIPLVQYFRAAKGSIKTETRDKQKSDRARVRFEARQQRLQSIEADMAAKRAARKSQAAHNKKEDAEKAVLDS